MTDCKMIKTTCCAECSEKTGGTNKRLLCRVASAFYALSLGQAPIHVKEDAESRAVASIKELVSWL